MAVLNKNEVHYEVAEVVDIDDEYEGGRVKIRIGGRDKNYSNEQLEYAFPALPKFLHFIPKVGEAVNIITSPTDGQKYYIGPIIPQPQAMYFSKYKMDANRLLRGAVIPPYTRLSNDPDSIGTMPEKDEVAFMGRDKCDMIMSDNDLRLRCGVRLRGYKVGTTMFDHETLKFNFLNPCFLKLSYHENPLSVTKEVLSVKNHDGTSLKKYSKTQDVVTTATLVADEINLISTNSNEDFDVSDQDKSITDEHLKRIIEKAHLLPYGDTLVEFLIFFKNAFLNHTHGYGPTQPVYDSTIKQLDSFDFSTLLSKNVRIN